MAMVFFVLLLIIGAFFAGGFYQARKDKKVCNGFEKRAEEAETRYEDYKRSYEKWAEEIAAWCKERDEWQELLMACASKKVKEVSLKGKAKFNQADAKKALGYFEGTCAPPVGITDTYDVCKD